MLTISTVLPLIVQTTFPRSSSSVDALHDNHGKVLETAGFRLGPGASPDIKYLQGGWEGKQSLRVERTFGTKPRSTGLLMEVQLSNVNLCPKGPMV